LVTLDAKKKAGALEAAAPQVGEIGSAMLARFIGRIEAKARAELEAWHLERRVNVVEMVGVLHDIARLRRDRPELRKSIEMGTPGTLQDLA
jgi:hypothetical protein